MKQSPLFQLVFWVVLFPLLVGVVSIIVVSNGKGFWNWVAIAYIYAAIRWAVVICWRATRDTAALANRTLRKVDEWSRKED